MGTDLIDQLHTVRPVGRAVWRTLDDGATRDELAAQLQVSRIATRDEMTAPIAVLMIMTLMVHMGVRPNPFITYGFDVFGPDGGPADVDAAPVALVTRMRMLTACANGDPESAADVFEAFAALHPYDVTDFLVDLAVRVHKMMRS